MGFVKFSSRPQLWAGVFLSIVVAGGCLRSQPERDNTIWVASSHQLWKLASDGHTVLYSSGAWEVDHPNGMSVDPSDGSLWAADEGSNQVVHFNNNCEVVSRTEDIFYNGYLWEAVVDPVDSTLWVADKYTIYHLEADGTVIASNDSVLPASHRDPTLMISPFDSSIWFVHNEDEQVFNFDRDLNLVWNTPPAAIANPTGLVFDAADGSAWVIDSDNSVLVHLASDGSELARTNTGEFGSLACLAAGRNGTLWACRVDDPGFGLVHLSSAGSLLADSPITAGRFNSLAVDPGSGAFIAIDADTDEIVRFDAVGTEVLRLESASGCSPRGVGPMRSDGGIWLAGVNDDGVDRVTLLDAAGVEVCASALPPFAGIRSLALDRSANVLWVGDASRGVLTKLDADGKELLRIEDPELGSFERMVVDPADHGIWVADWNHGRLTRVNQSGIIEHSTEEELCGVPSVALNEIDGSIWIADGCELLHFGRNGQLIERLSDPSVPEPNRVAISPQDGSLWVMSRNQSAVAHLTNEGEFLVPDVAGLSLRQPNNITVTEAGEAIIANTDNHEIIVLRPDMTERSHTPNGGYSYPRGLSLDPATGMFWVADTGSEQIALVDVDGAEHFRSARRSFPGVQLVVVGRMR